MGKGTISKQFLDKVDDIQALNSGFPRIPIQKVGVRNIKIPFTLKVKGQEEMFHTVASVSSYCELDENKKGINMSRISRSINDSIPQFGCYEQVEQAVKDLKRNHGSESAWIKIKFEYIIKTKSPLSFLDSYEPADVEMRCHIDKNNKIINILSVTTIAASLCPCSKNMSLLMNNLTNDEKDWFNDKNNVMSMPVGLLEKISKSGFGAHNQKSKIKVSVQVDENMMHHVWIEDIIECIRSNASCPTFTTLKREDEKFVTEVAYMGGYYDDNGEFNQPFGDVSSGPAFVEDIARNIAFSLNNYDAKIIKDYTITVENEESIHSGDIAAVAVLYKYRDLK